MRKLVIILAVLIPSIAWSGARYVKTTGVNGASGTSWGTAWLTIGYGCANLSSGDTLFVREGTYTGDENCLTAGNSRTYIAVANGGADTVLIYNVRLGIRVANRNNVTIKGFGVRDASYRWVVVSNGCYRIHIENFRGYMLSKSEHGSFVNFMVSADSNSYVTGQWGNQHHIRLKNLRLFGDWNYPDSLGATPGETYGPNPKEQCTDDGLTVSDTDTCEISGFYATGWTHYPLNPRSYARYVYMDRDTCISNHGSWGAAGGCRDFVLQNSLSKDFAFNAERAGGGGQWGTWRMIQRFNKTIFDGVRRNLNALVSAAISNIDSYDDIVPRDQRYYHNTHVARNRTSVPVRAYLYPDTISYLFGLTEGRPTGPYWYNVNQNKIINNIFAYPEASPAVLGLHVDSDSNYWDGNKSFAYPGRTVYHDQGPGLPYLATLSDTSHIVYGMNSGKVLSWAHAHTLYPWRVGPDNGVVYPQFSDTAVGSPFTIATTSALVDAAIPLTHTSSAGSGTSIGVDDGLFFFDGWGGFAPADSIYVNGEAVGLTSKSGNTLNISRSISWGDNDGVWLYRGGEVVNDVGPPPSLGVIPPVLSIATSSPLPSGTKSVAYSASITAAYGTAPYSFAVISGALPSGLGMSSAGAVTGTPTSIGAFSFTARVTDAVSATATKVFVLTIADYTSTPPIQKLWACDGQQIIRWNTRDSPARDKDSNLVWNESAGSINVFALKNDVVSFQVVMEAGATAVDSVNVDLRFLQQAGVADIKNTAANCTTFVGRDIEGFLESYVNLTETSNERAETIFWHNSYPTPTDKYIGWIPQQLVPLEAPRGAYVRGTDTLQSGAGGPTGPGFRIYANKNATVWYDIRVDKSKPAGLYAGELLVYRVSRGDTLFRVPVNLTVYNHQLSDTSHLPTMMHLHDVDVAYRGGVSMYTPYYWSWLQRADFFYRRHRLNMILTKESVDSLNAHRKGIYSGTAYTTANGYEGQGQNRGNDLYIAALWNINNYWYPTLGYQIGQVGPYDDTQSGWRNLSDAFEQFFLTNAPHVRRAVEMIDEPKNHDEDGGVQRSDIHSRAAWIRTGTGVGKNLNTFIPNGWLDPWTVEGVPAFGWKSDISMWAQNPVSDSWGLGYNTDKYNPRHSADPWTVEEVVEMGAANPTPTTISTYNGSPGFTPVVGSLDVPLTEPLLFPVLAMKYNLPWLWYWTGTYWSEISTVDANPWVETNYAMNQSDDGNLVSYGRDKMYPADDRGVNTLIASLRLKALRDGLRIAEMMYDCQRYGVYDTTWTRTMGVYAGFNDWRFPQFQWNSPPPWAQNGYLVEAVRKQMALALDGGEEPSPPETPTGWILLRR